MKKCYFILGLILATSSANAAVDKNLADPTRKNISDFCWTMMTENGTPQKANEAKQFCKTVANCVVKRAPNNYALQDSTFLENAFTTCLYSEAQKIAQ